LQLEIAVCGTAAPDNVVVEADMSQVSVTEALQFVRTAELPHFERSPFEKTTSGLERAAAEFDFDKTRDQAMSVGSDIVSFVKGVTEQRRRDITNCALLAQLIANNKVPRQHDALKWYDAYFDALTRIGWVVQSKQFVGHQENRDSFSAHEAILSIAATLLAATPAALAVVKATLDAVSKLDKDGPWITLFNQESQQAHSAWFQVTLAEQEEGGQFLVSLMAFALSAKATVTQVLLIRFRSNEVKLQHSSGKVTISATVLDAIRPEVEKKLAVAASKFIMSLPDL
jgi:hypothetical protein